MFSVALYQIIVGLSLALDIDRILVHATGRVNPITCREADAQISSSFLTRFHDFLGNTQKMVRSTVLPVTRGRQIAQEPILLPADLDPPLNYDISDPSPSNE